jgi:hypothetical protein
MKGDSAPKQPKETRCTARQLNRQAPDFDCKLLGGHTIHVTSTGVRWGEGRHPRGWHRSWSARRYANPKLARHAKRR